MTPHHSPVFVPYRITCRLLVPSCVVSHNLATGHSKSYLPSSFQKEDLLTSTPFQTFRATCPWDISCWLFIPPSFPWDGGHTTFMKRTLDPGHRRHGRGQVSRADAPQCPQTPDGPAAWGALLVPSSRSNFRSQTKCQ